MTPRLHSRYVSWISCRDVMARTERCMHISIVACLMLTVKQFVLSEEKEPFGASLTISLPAGAHPKVRAVIERKHALLLPHSARCMLYREPHSRSVSPTPPLLPRQRSNGCPQGVYVWSSPSLFTHPCSCQICSCPALTLYAMAT